MLQVPRLEWGGRMSGSGLARRARWTGAVTVLVRSARGEGEARAVDGVSCGLRASSWDELGEREGGVDEGVDRDEGGERLEPARVEDGGGEQDAAEQGQWSSAGCGTVSRGT